MVIEIRRHSGVEAAAWADRVWRCYDEVFGDYDDQQVWREELFDRHAARDGYRLATATEGDTVVGFGWGYVGRRGEYWSDLLCEVLPAEVCEEWVGGHFDLVELAVLASHRGRGLGRRLHDLVLDGVTRRCLLTTDDDPDDPAVRLYRSAGWERLAELRPGRQVMGRPQAVAQDRSEPS